MHNPAYLMLSRHSVYYFRWPIPLTLRPQTSATHVVLSLGTRKPAEALHLSRLLEYHASQLIKQYGPSLRLTYYRALPAVYREIIRFSQEHENFDFGQAPILSSPSPAPQQSAHPLSLTAERFVKMQMEDQKWDENTKNERLAHIQCASKPR